MSKRLDSLGENFSSNCLHEELEYFDVCHEKVAVPSTIKGIITSSKIPTDGLDLFTVHRTKDVANVLAILLFEGLIEIKNLRGGVVDFGCGAGSSAHVLKQYGGRVTGVDIDPNNIQCAITQGILSPDTSYKGDGFEYLTQEVKPSSIDFLSAFMIVSQLNVGDLYGCSDRVLKHGGQLLVTGMTDSEPNIDKYSWIGKTRDCLSEYCLIYTKR
jgi:SAM-dependent methyltransferase